MQEAACWAIMERLTQQLFMIEPVSNVTLLLQRLGLNLPVMDGARLKAQDYRQKLDEGLAELASADVSVVLFGSLARDEFTEGSDIDWTALIDGEADPQHLELARRIRSVVSSIWQKEPGPEGIFGNLAFSHEIVHQIGGEDDSNSNTTKRILLLLESKPVGRRDAYDRVLNHTLTRYIKEDGRFLEVSARYHVPRFLLNDFARYWRTMAVDFAYKRRNRGGKGAAIRNIKLRMSRKLIFVSGLLACFSLHLVIAEEDRKALIGSAYPTQEFVRHMRRQLSLTPLEILAQIIIFHPHLEQVGARLFNSYEQFLGVLADKELRTELEELQPEEEEDSLLLQRLRTVSHEFRDALLELFFDEASGLQQLTRTYGIF
jgi:predicted nucleotidyltransferase